MAGWDGRSSACALFTARDCIKWRGRGMRGKYMNAKGQELLSNLRSQLARRSSSRWYQTHADVALGSGRNFCSGWLLNRGFRVFCAAGMTEPSPSWHRGVLRLVQRHLHPSKNLFPLETHLCFFCFFLVWESTGFSQNVSSSASKKSTANRREKKMTSGRWRYAVWCLWACVCYSNPLDCALWWMESYPVCQHRTGQSWFSMVSQLKFPLAAANPLPPFISLFFPFKTSLSSSPAWLQAQHVFSLPKPLCHLSFCLFYSQFQHSAHTLAVWLAKHVRNCRMAKNF